MRILEKPESLDICLLRYTTMLRLKKTDHGACVYYPNSGYKEEVGSEGKMAAASIQKQLVALGLKNNGILYRNSAVGSRYPDKSKADYYAVIKRSKYAGFPGLIVEACLCSADNDAALQHF